MSDCGQQHTLRTLPSFPAPRHPHRPVLQLWQSITLEKSCHATRLAIILLLLGIGLISLAGRAAAHFQVLLPSTDIVEDQDARTIDLDLRFTHPMEQGPTMNMARPRQVAVLVGGKRIDLAGRLKPRKVDGKSAYHLLAADDHARRLCRLRRARTLLGSGRSRR